ncbi:MAG: hypothetical protein LBQ66_04190 [Planctomycetaceae bacterium]|jgi:hypothetical protein|nr:hypothetical protein [Planctomycetaceae bacterium]
MELRITKYNPCYRHPNGAYYKNEWTEVCDIGKTFEGEIFTATQYLQTEDSYVKTVLLLLKHIGLENLVVVKQDDLSARRIIYPFFTTNAFFNVDPKFAKSIKPGRICSLAEIEILTRASLRSNFWCAFGGDYGTYLHFGWDYYMYFGTEKTVCLNDIDFPEGIFIEQNFPSPYCQDNEDENED